MTSPESLYRFSSYGEEAKTFLLKRWGESFLPKQQAEEQAEEIVVLVERGLRDSERPIYLLRLKAENRGYNQLSSLEKAHLAVEQGSWLTRLINEAVGLLCQAEESFLERANSFPPAASLALVFYLRENFFGLHFIRSPQKFVEKGNPTSIEGFLNNYLAAADFLASFSQSDGDYRKRFCFFLEVLFRELVEKNPPRFAAMLAGIEEVAESLALSSNLSRLVEGSYYEKSFQRAKGEIERSRRIREAYRSLSPEKRSLLQAVRVDTPGVVLSYQDLFEDWAGLNPSQIGFAQRGLAAKYGLSPQAIEKRIALIWDFIQGRLKLETPRNFLEEVSGYPYDLVVFLRLVSLVDPTKQLEEMIQEGRWRNSYRSLGIAQFRLFLLKETERIIRQASPRLSFLRLWKELAGAAERWVADYCGIDPSMVSIAPGVVSRMISKMTSTTSPFVLKAKTGLKTEERILAYDLLSGGGWRESWTVSVGMVPTHIVYQELASVGKGEGVGGYRREIAEGLDLSGTTLSNLCKTLCIEGVLAGVLSQKQWEDIFEYSARLTCFLDDQEIDPRKLVVIPSLSQREIALQIGRAFLFTTLMKGKQRLRDFLVEEMAELVARESQLLPFEKFLLEKTVEGFSGRAIAREINASLRKHDLVLTQRQLNELFIIVSETLKILLRFPLSWREAQEAVEEWEDWVW